MKPGVRAEQLAADYLQRHGLKLLDRNYRCRFGEIDLILRDGDALVFVEVRKRSNSGYGGAAGSIDSHKQRRIVLTAQHYMASLRADPPCRFDAVLLDANDRVEWLKNAFGV
jgi:putative endonuclease